jgi:hypothetical protein
MIDMQNPRIMIGVRDGALTASFIGSVLEGAGRILEGLNLDTDKLNETLLERVKSLSSPTGIINLELPNENIVRRIDVTSPPQVPHAA